MRKRRSPGMAARAAAVGGGIAVVLCWAATPVPAAAQLGLGGALPPPLPLLPPDNWWNLDVSGAPVDPASSSLIGFIGPGTGLHPDFGGDDTSTLNGIFGFPYAVVPGSQP